MQQDRGRKFRDRRSNVVLVKLLLASRGNLTRGDLRWSQIGHMPMRLITIRMRVFHRQPCAWDQGSQEQ